MVKITSKKCVLTPDNKREQFLYYIKCTEKYYIGHLCMKKNCNNGYLTALKFNLQLYNVKLF